jgi:hypothetical protein
MAECRPRPEWDAFTLKREYLDFMRFLDGPVDPPLKQIEEAQGPHHPPGVAEIGRRPAYVPRMGLEWARLSSRSQL